MSSDECPICLGVPSDPIETNCAHKYCAKCITLYWETTSGYPMACKCPYCRRQVNLLMPVGNIRDRELLQKVNDYNRRMCRTSIPIISQARDSPTVLRHMFSELISTGGISFCNRIWIIVLLIFAMIYFISPVDLIPELILGPIGYIDDIGSIIAVLLYVMQLYRRDLSQRTL